VIELGIINLLEDIYGVSTVDSQDKCHAMCSICHDTVATAPVVTESSLFMCVCAPSESLRGSLPRQTTRLQPATAEVEEVGNSES